MSRALVTAPTSEPLTIREVCARVAIDSRNVEPAPDAPTAALLSPAAAGNVDNGAHRYRVTFVTADGETDGGTISTPVTVADKTVNGKVALSAVPLGGSQVTSRKLYRTVAAGSSYLLLATIADNTTTTYTDNLADSALGAGVPSTNTTLDPLLASLLKSARQTLEEVYGRAFLTQTWRLTLDQFPACGEIELPMPVLASVTSIQYVDAAGVTQPLATSVYAVDVDHFPGRVVLKYAQYWPQIRGDYNGIVITFVAGFTSAALVPENWKHALAMLVKDQYEQHDDDADVIRALMYPTRYLEVA